MGPSSDILQNLPIRQVGQQLCHIFIRESSDHNNLLKSLEEETTVLNTGKCPPLYHGGLKKIVQPIMIPLFCNADQPERQELYRTKLGKASNHARWRYSCNYNKVGSFLPSYERCKSKVERFCKRGQLMFQENRCNLCTNWEYLG